MARADGFEKGLADHGAPMVPELRYEGTYLSPSGIEAVGWLLDRHGSNLPSAIFFSNYFMALGGFAALHDRGLKVPDDIAVAVFGDHPQMEYVRPRLTRVGVAPSVLAARASHMLIDRLEERFSGPSRSEIIPCRLHAMETA